MIRYIPGRTRVKVEFARNITLGDVIMFLLCVAALGLILLSKGFGEYKLWFALSWIIISIAFFIPIDDGLTAELDVFEGLFDGLVFVEVEFDSLDAATTFEPPEWFDEDVTKDRRYHNSYLSQLSEFDINDFK